MRSWRGWRTSLHPAFKHERCLADFFNFDHRFEALVGCACSRIAGRKKIDGTKRKDGMMVNGKCEKKKMAKKMKGGNGLNEEMWGGGGRRKSEKEEETLEKDQDLSWDCWQFSKRIPILTTAAQQDVEMADTLLCISTSADFNDGWTCHYSTTISLVSFLFPKSAVSNKILQLEGEVKSQPYFNKLYSR